MPISKARLRISDYNKNRKSKLKNQERKVKSVSLSLTSMVDMFAILVIFLLANSSTFSEWLSVGNGIDLPRAKSNVVPEKAASVQLSKDTVIIDDKPFMSLAALSTGDGKFKAWLNHLEKKNGYINLVAHKTIHFGIIKKVIGLCQDAGFNNVNLAVQPRG